jgi:hypothetical protein
VTNKNTNTQDNPNKLQAVDMHWAIEGPSPRKPTEADNMDTHGLRRRGGVREDDIIRELRESRRQAQPSERAREKLRMAGHNQ